MTGEPATQAALASLLLDPEGPSVVAIGGGTGQAAALEAMQLYAGSVTAVVSVADDGGSSGRLTDAMDLPAPGDIRRCLLALTPEPSLVAELFAHRFRTGDVTDHSLGNLMLAALADLTGDFGSAVDAAGRMLGTVGTVVPATASPVRLRAKVAGTLIEGQALISRARGGVEAIEMVPSEAEAYPAALDAIAAADQIVLGPGSLYTSVVAALLVPGLAEAVMGSSAQKVFVANLVTQDGETWDLDGAGHIAALEDHAGVRAPGIVLAHHGPLDVPARHRAITFDEPPSGWELHHADVADHLADWPAHDPVALGQALQQVLA